MAKLFRPGKTCTSCASTFNPIQLKKSGKGAGRFYYCDSMVTCSDVCASNVWRISAAKNLPPRSGKDHHRWTGYSERKGAWRGPEWPRIAEQVRVNQGRECAHCGASESDNGRRLDVHHIIPFHNFKTRSMANARKNLIGLCRSCHAKADAAADHQQSLMLTSGGVSGVTRPGRARGSRVNTSKLSAKEVILLRADRSCGMSIPKLSEKYKIARSSVWNIIHGRSWAPHQG